MTRSDQGETDPDHLLKSEMKSPEDVVPREVEATARAAGYYRLWLGLILAGYVIITLLYGVVNPLFEAPDEVWHFFTAQFLAENRKLPFVAPGDTYDEWLSQEAAQPPLYYGLGALLIAPLDTAVAKELVLPNKFAVVGKADTLINVNRFIHTENEAWPWRGYVLGVHLLRWLSTLFGLGTLLTIYATGRLLKPADTYRALLATALVAFLPQFNFLHAAVTNDSLIIFLVSLTIWQLVRMWQTDVSAGRLLSLGLTIGMAVLAKNVGIILLAYAVGFLLLLALWNGRSAATPSGLAGWRLVGATLALVVAPALLLGGWLWARNWALYGDFTATNQFIRLAGGDRDYTIWQVLNESSGLWLSSFAIFGWFNLRAPAWVYWFWSGLVGLSLVGAVWGAFRRAVERRNSASGYEIAAELSVRLTRVLRQGWVLPLLLAIWVVVVYGGLAAFMMRTEAAQGRLLFPALVPLALGVASGLTATTLLRRLSPLLAAAALVTTVYCLYFVIQPTYQKPPTVADLPSEALELGVEMGHGIKLVGALLETEKTEPGQAAWLTLYWRADNLREAMPEFVVSVFGRNGVEIGKVHSYHGRGLYPAGMWPEGQIIADRFGIRIDEMTQAPVLASVDATLLGGSTSAIGEIKIEPGEWQAISDELLAQFGPHIALTAVRLGPQLAEPGDVISLVTEWRVSGVPEVDYTTLVHLGQPDATPLATGDRPPLSGDYPTRAWESGEYITDRYELALPGDLAPGRYPVWLGMYDAKSLERLPVSIGGELQPFDVYLAGWVDVE